MRVASRQDQGAIVGLSVALRQAAQHYFFAEYGGVHSPLCRTGGAASVLTDRSSASKFNIATCARRARVHSASLSSKPRCRRGRKGTFGWPSRGAVGRRLAKSCAKSS